MKKTWKGKAGIASIASCSLLVMLLMNSCKKDNNDDKNVIPQNFTEVNLVASNSTYGASRVDPNYINGWGIAFSPSGNAWISSQGNGTSVIYDKTGAEKLAPVSIPSPTATTGGSPTGQVFNGSTTDFLIPGSTAARFIFTGTDGIISGWNAGSAAVKMIDRSATSVYTGLAIGSNGGNNYLYAADFKSGKIDVFDKNLALVAMSFSDPSLPSGYSPFNVQAVNGQLYVMYAKVDEATHEEAKGDGLGYVNVFSMDGSLVKRYISQGALNAPWGIAAAPDNFINGMTGVILVGNFGDGRINAFDAAGNFIGSLRSNGVVITIDGLWAISFAPSTATTVDPNWLFFAAGPSDENQGLFGYVTK